MKALRESIMDDDEELDKRTEPEIIFQSLRDALNDPKHRPTVTGTYNQKIIEILYKAKLLKSNRNLYCSVYEAGADNYTVHFFVSTGGRVNELSFVSIYKDGRIHILIDETDYLASIYLDLVKLRKFFKDLGFEFDIRKGIYIKKL